MRRTLLVIFVLAFFAGLAYADIVAEKTSVLDTHILRLEKMKADIQKDNETYANADIAMIDKYLSQPLIEPEKSVVTAARDSIGKDKKAYADKKIQALDASIKMDQDKKAEISK